MSPLLASKTTLICLYLLFQSPLLTVSGTSTITCSRSDPDFEYDGNQCAEDYTDLIQPYSKDVDRTDMSGFWLYLRDLPGITYNWYTFWEDQKQSPDISHCNAIQPIPDDSIPSTHCLCQLNYVCDDFCDDQIQEIWTDTVGLLISQQPYKIPYEYGATTADCSNVLAKITNYETLCGDTEIYQVIEQCANVTSNPATSPDSQSTPSPTTSTTASATTATPGTAVLQNTEAEANSTTLSPPTPSPTETGTAITDKPTPAPSVTSETSSAPTASATTTTLNPSPAANKTDTDSNWDYGDYYNNLDETQYSEDEAQLDSQDSFDTPSSTDALAISYEDSHPFANLLLVSLIILGFCVFVAWYAKKNQITSEDGIGREDDNGYLWGLNKTSPSAEQNMMSGATINETKRGRIRHKKLSDFDEQSMNIQMTMNNDNDLLSITPDHVGRLQTRAPNDIHSTGKPMKKTKMKTKRKGKGGKFQQLHDDDEENDLENEFEGSSCSDSEDGVDMMKMRDQYYASQTFSKKLADTLGDIHDTVKVTAAAVKDKLSKKEQTVVVPMQIKASKKQKHAQKGDKMKKKYPFTMVEDNETTDGFDLSEDDSSESTQEMEYREDPVTEVRMNIHGRKIKQPMGLPTFNNEDDEEEEVEADAAHITAANATAAARDKKKKEHHHHKKRKKDKKKKKKKDKRKHEPKQQKKDKDVEIEMEQHHVSDDKGANAANHVVDSDKNKMKVETESHDINITINNDDNMGFGADELHEDHIQNIEELTQEEEVLTVNDLQKELMKHSATANINNDIEINSDNNSNANKKSVDLSFMDDMVQALESNKDDDNNAVVGNGNAVAAEATQS